MHYEWDIWNGPDSEPSHIFHNAWDKYPTMHHSVAENMHACAHSCYKMDMERCGVWSVRYVAKE